jgi:hypothetical protein
LFNRGKWSDVVGLNRDHVRAKSRHRLLVYNMSLYFHLDFLPAALHNCPFVCLM